MWSEETVAGTHQPTLLLGRPAKASESETKFVSLSQGRLQEKGQKNPIISYTFLYLFFFIIVEFYLYTVKPCSRITYL